MNLYIYASDKPKAQPGMAGPARWITIKVGESSICIFLPNESDAGPALAEALNKALGND